MSQYLHDDNNDDVKAITIPWVFSENSRTKTEMFVTRIFSFPNTVETL